MRKLIAAVIVLCGCASQGVPPGGPPDAQAPKVIAISPDSGRTAVKGGSAIFRFDEVVSERPQGVTNLGDLFVVSPRQGAPNVSWHREQINVKPRKGWLPNTTYTVTMLPGIADLRGNVKNTGASTFFSTGPRIDDGAIVGSVYDLITGTTANGALVEARVGTDSTVSWITRADTAGAFRLEHLPRKPFNVRAYVDRNRNFGADPDEPVDTASVTAADSAQAVFFLAVRDSVAPRIVTAVVFDSVNVNLTFDRPSDSLSATTAANYSIRGSDSSSIPILAVAASARDSTRKLPPTKRVMPLSSVRVTLARPMLEKVQYRIRGVGIRGLIGQTAPTEARITLPAPLLPVRPPVPPNLPGGAVPMPIKHE